MPETPSTHLVWVRRELRVHDLPALVAACARSERVAVVLVLEEELLRARSSASVPLAAFSAAVRALDAELRARGSALVVRRGDPRAVLPALCAEVGAAALHVTSDPSPHARRRDPEVAAALAAQGVEVVHQPGTYVCDVHAIGTFAVFTPFLRRWERAERRPVLPAPERLPPLPDGLALEPLPDLGALPPEPVAVPGEAAARAALDAVVEAGLDVYDRGLDDLDTGTTHLSPHLRWGCLSPREVEERLLRRLGGTPPEGGWPNEGAGAIRRQLAWRDFHAHVLLREPTLASRALRPGLERLEVDEDPARLDAWRAGRTGFPLVDAGMRQLARTGWMHNRVRMVVASFLTKDLHLDWRAGERHFRAHLLDGDVAQNAAGWQFAASLGLDHTPFRMFNPTTYGERFDPHGRYVRRWVPELAPLPDAGVHAPWALGPLDLLAAGVTLGETYPERIVDHDAERREAQRRYAEAAPA